MSATRPQLTAAQLRATWFRRQWLAEPRGEAPAAAVRASGWIYSPGSTLPYLSIQARCGRDRSAIDGAIFDEGSLVEVPTVRGCTMLVPREDAPLAAAGGRRWTAKRLDAARASCAVTPREIDRLGSAIVALLTDSPMAASEIQARLPARLVRDLGAAGRRLGEASTLTLALRVLQQEMAVQRVAADRRLDGRSYAYRLLPPEMPRRVPPAEEADRALAERFFAWAAPATIDELAWWAGISRTTARRAIAGLALAPVAVEGWSEEAFLPEADVDLAFASREPGADEPVVLLPFRDNYLYFRRGLGVFLDEGAKSVQVLDWMRRPAALGTLDSLHHNAIIVGGRLAGCWEWDPDAGDVAWRVFGRASAAARSRIEAAIEGLRKTVRSRLGDVAFYAFDKGRNRRQRIDSLAGPPRHRLARTRSR